MSDGPTVNIDAFLSRYQQVQRALDGTNSDPDCSLSNVQGLLILTGNQDEDNPYRKTVAFQTWLLGYEFPSMLFAMLKDRLICVGSAQKMRILGPIGPALEKAHGVKVELHVRGKDEAANKEIWEKTTSALKGLSLGSIPKDVPTGKFVEEWKAQASGIDATTDVSAQLASLMAAKSSSEIALQHTAARASTTLMGYFADEMQRIVEANERTTHEKFADKIEQQIEQPALWKKFISPTGAGQFDRTMAETAYTPIIQSGGTYDVKPTASSDEGRFTAGVVISSIGVRYKSYCANVARTYFVDPHASQEENYNFLLKLQTHAYSLLKDGAVISEVYRDTLEYVKNQKPDLVSAFPKTLGFATGIEFRESALVLGPKINRTLRNDMVVSLQLSLHGLPDPKDSKKTYSLLLIDTVQVQAEGAKPLSEAAKKLKEVAFYFANEPPKKSEANGDVKPDVNGAGPSERRSRTTVVKSKLRNEGQPTNNGAAQQRAEHQARLRERLNAEGLEKYQPGGSAAAKGKAAKDKSWKRFESYQRETQLPEAIKDQRIVVDNRKNTVILPINGYGVPFHVNTLKSVIKQEEGDYTSLRFMFITPGQIAGKKEDTIFEDPDASFIRTLTYRSADSYRFSELHKEITELKKSVVKRETEKREMADVVDQDNLVEERARRPARLRDVWLRPPFEGKRSTGDVEIHQNGIRWASSARSDHKVDVLFSNIKHLLFQPCDNELLVIIHVSLKSPIIIGKKKVKELQFFREASEAAFDETGNKKRRRGMDEDEIEMEQAERRLRKELNREFKSYAEKIAEASKGQFEVDMPFRDLGFNGVPHRAGVLVSPTSECLVHLSEFPPFVLTIAEIEIVHLERVQFGLRNFDVVFVFKDYSKPPVHVNTVPMSQLDVVKEWIDSSDLPYTEGPVNLNWSAIMKTVQEDVYLFFQEGGWNFLTAGDVGSDGEPDDDSEVEDAFKPESSDVAAEEEESDFSEADSDADDGEFDKDSEISDIASEGGTDDGSEEEKPKKSKSKK